MAITLNGDTGITTPAETIQGNLTTTGNTILGDASTDTLNVGNGGLIKDASGNVGIGTSSPVAKLDVRGIFAISNSAASYWALDRNDSDGSLTFTDTSTERMRIDSSGNLLVGTTTQADSGKQSVRFNGLIQKGIGIQDIENASGARFISFVGAGGGSIGSIERVGITNAVVYNTTSDLRLKSNIVDADPVLDKLMQVQVRQYDWTEGDLHQDYGFIAQELEPVLTGIVTKGKTEEDMWQLDYSRLTPHLVKAIQEQQAMIDELKAKVAALEAA
jgi:hypothetical protein